MARKKVPADPPLATSWEDLAVRFEVCADGENPLTLDWTAVEGREQYGHWVDHPDTPAPLWEAFRGLVLQAALACELNVSQRPSPQEHDPVLYHHLMSEGRDSEADFRGLNDWMVRAWLELLRQAQPDFEVTLTERRIGEYTNRILKGSLVDVPKISAEKCRDFAREGMRFDPQYREMVARLDRSEAEGRSQHRALALAAEEIPGARAALQKDVGEAIQRHRPRTEAQVNDFIYQYLAAYAEKVFDVIAQSRFDAKAIRSYEAWLRRTVVPAVLGDVCLPIRGAYHLAVEHATRVIGETTWLEDLEPARRSLWRILSEAIWGPNLDNLRSRLEAHLGARTGHWKSEFLRRKQGRPQRKKDLTGSEKSRAGDGALLEGKNAVSFLVAERYLGIEERWRQKLIKGKKLEVVGRGHNQKITTESLRKYRPPENPH